MFLLMIVQTGVNYDIVYVQQGVCSTLEIYCIATFCTEYIQVLDVHLKSNCFVRMYSQFQVGDVICAGCQTF